MCERMRIIHGPCYTCQWRTMACKLLIYLVLIRDRRFCLLPLLVEWTAPCTTHVRTNCELHISLLSEKYHDIWSKWIQVRYSWRNSSRNGSTEPFVWLCMRVLGVLTIHGCVDWMDNLKSLPITIQGDDHQTLFSFLGAFDHCLGDLWSRDKPLTISQTHQHSHTYTHTHLHIERDNNSIRGYKSVNSIA